MLRAFRQHAGCCWLKFDDERQHQQQTTPSMSQHVATGWPNARNMPLLAVWRSFKNTLKHWALRHLLGLRYPATSFHILMSVILFLSTQVRKPLFALLETKIEETWDKCHLRLLGTKQTTRSNPVSTSYCEMRLVPKLFSFLKWWIEKH